MSPEGICPECGNKRMFHPAEMKDVKAGKVMCTACTIENGYYIFLGEVLEGEHKELIEELREELEEEV